MIPHAENNLAFAPLDTNSAVPVYPDIELATILPEAALVEIAHLLFLRLIAQLAARSYLFALDPY